MASFAPNATRLVTYSILVAARDEAASIGACLACLARLDCAPGTVEVWVGDDGSQDDTARIVRAFAARHPHFFLLPIAPPTGQLRGKANALAQLARRARGRYLVFTDADVRVPPDWLTTLTAPLTVDVGVVAGLTLPAGQGSFARLQALDWLHGFALVHILAGWGVPLTAMGNNLLVSREAYDATGGYENLPASLTEDCALFRAVVGRGFGFRQCYQSAGLAYTAPVPTLAALLWQRQRWLRGARQLLPWPWVGMLYAQALFAPAALLLAAVAPGWGLGLLAAKVTVQLAFLTRNVWRLRQTRLLPWVPLFALYEAALLLATVAYDVTHPTVVWKGRRYPPG